MPAARDGPRTQLTGLSLPTPLHSAVLHTDNTPLCKPTLSHPHRTPEPHTDNTPLWTPTLTHPHRTPEPHTEATLSKDSANDNQTKRLASYPHFPSHVQESNIHNVPAVDEMFGNPALHCSRARGKRDWEWPSLSLADIMEQRYSSHHQMLGNNNTTHSSPALVTDYILRHNPPRDSKILGKHNLVCHGRFFSRSFPLPSARDATQCVPPSVSAG